MTPQEPPLYFRHPNIIERILNRIFGWLVGLGLGRRHNYLLQVRGRKSGKIYWTPVNLLMYKGRLFLVAGRGHTQWVRNALVAQHVTLKKGKGRLGFGLRVVPDAEKAEILHAYVNRFQLTVQRYFPVPADAPVEAFVPLAPRHPVFELVRSA